MNTVHIIDEFSGYYCLECKSLCGVYEQGLSCNCGNHWETEEIYKEDYPPKWLRVWIVVKLNNHELSDIEQLSFICNKC